MFDSLFVFCLGCLVLVDRSISGDCAEDIWECMGRVVAERFGRIAWHRICEHMARNVKCGCVPSKDVYRDPRRPSLDRHTTTVFQNLFSSS